MNPSKLLSKAAEDWPAKVISIVLAIALFVFNRMNNLEERFFSTPLHIEVNNDLALATPYPRTIRVTLRGEANSIHTILEEDIEAYLDLSKYTLEGAYRAPVQIRKQGTALGVEPLEINVDPLEVFIQLDQKISKQVSLAPDFQGHLEPGYELVSYTMTPSQVVVDGPLRLIASLSALPTAAIELGGRNQDFSTQLRIVNPDPLLLIRGDGMTEFRGFIRNLIIIRNFEGLPLRLQNLREDLIAEPELYQGGLRLQGEQRALEDYDGGDLILNLDCGAIDTPGTYRIPVRADVPSVFTLIRSEPAEINVQVRPRNEEEER